MNFRGGRRRRRDAADLEITPLIDVVFLLLIFFMLTSTFARKQTSPTDQISVELPRVTAESTGDASTPIVVVVQADGSIDIRGVQQDTGDGDQPEANDQTRTVSESEDVVSILKNVRSRRADAPILLTGDREASHGRIVELLGNLREAGFDEVQIATRPDD